MVFGRKPGGTGNEVNPVDFSMDVPLRIEIARVVSMNLLLGVERQAVFRHFSALVQLLTI
jgi:hypothetical protein